MAGYTKGEWFVDPEIMSIIAKKENSEALICDVQTKGYILLESIANARLISAAPDLLNACVGLLGAMPPALQKKWPNNIKRAQKAIAKAEKS